MCMLLHGFFLYNNPFIWSLNCDSCQVIPFLVFILAHANNTHTTLAFTSLLLTPIWVSGPRKIHRRWSCRSLFLIFVKSCVFLCCHLRNYIRERFRSAEILRVRKVRRHMPTMMSSYIWCQSQQTCFNRFYIRFLFGQIHWNQLTINCGGCWKKETHESDVT